MNNTNVCKFPITHSESTLKTISFVWEKDAQVLSNPKLLKNHHLYLITDGQGEICFNGKLSYPLKTGALVFGFEGETCSCKNFSNLEYAYITFEGLRSEELFTRFNLNPQNRIFAGYDFLIPLWKESLFFADQTNTDLACESTLLYAFSKLSATNQIGNPLVDKMKKLACENFSNVQFSLASLSEHLKYNQKYLSHVFKNHTKTGFTDYLRSIRIKNAVTLFDYGLDSVKNVALLSGFNDPLYFSSVFKKEVGLSPKQYIEKVQHHDQQV